MAKNMTKNKIQQEFEEWCLEKLKSCENIQEAVDIVKLYENAMGDKPGCIIRDDDDDDDYDDDDE